jgi:CDP-glucose 4,6-dehydratase
MEKLVKRKLNRSFWEGKKILLTGHTGFKGSWLTKILFSLGSNVDGYSNSIPLNGMFNILKLKKNINFSEEDDIRDFNRLSKVFSKKKYDILIHFAAQPLVLESYKHLIDTYDTNVMGTGNVLYNSLKSNVSRNLVITTDKVYLNDDSKKIFKENDSLGANDPYSGSKAASEFISMNIFQSFDNLAVATARAGNVIGGGDFSKDRIVPDFFHAYQNSSTLSLRYPNAIRPWQHVLEPIEGYLFLIEDMKENDDFTSFNFGPDSNSFKTVSALVQQLSFNGMRVTVKEDNNARKLKESNFLMLNNYKAKKILNWYPCFSFEQTVETVSSWYKCYLHELSEIEKFTDDQIKQYLS